MYMELICIVSSSLTTRNDYSEGPLFKGCLWFVVDSLWMGTPVS